MERTFERVLYDEVSISASQDENAVNEWLADCRKRWRKNFPLQPEEAGKAALLAAMGARAYLGGSEADLLERGMDKALEEVDLEEIETIWGRSYDDNVVDAYKLAALHIFAREYAMGVAMGVAEVFVTVLLRARFLEHAGKTREDVARTAAEDMHLPLALVGEVAGLPAMASGPAEAEPEGGWMASSEAVDIWGEAQIRRRMQDDWDRINESRARGKRRWLKSLPLRHVVNRGLEVLDKERERWQARLAGRLEAAGRKRADAAAAAQAAACEAERWRIARWEGLLEEGRAEALCSPSMEDKAWDCYSEWPGYVADAFMASHVQVFAETHAHRQAQSHADAALRLAPWVGRGVDVKAFCALADMTEQEARHFIQAVSR
ncbi:MAG: hypothetical protein IK061_09090 [Desulfovibrio sp.]|nr:hypothetical protein [Desulfovibrio sp.]